MANADWSKPGLSDTYANFLAYLVSRDEDAATMFNGTPTNIPANTIRYNRSTDGLEEYITGSWVPKVLSVVAGGTGGNTASAARTALGIGTMGTQANNAVNITGGSIVPDTLMKLKCDLTLDADASYNVGSNAAKVKNAYIGTGLVIPVGTNKWVVS